MSRRLPLDPDGRRQRTDPSFQPGSTRGRIGNASPIGDGGGRGRVRPTSPGNSGPGGGVQFFDELDTVALTVAGAQSKVLTYLPLPYSEHVFLNGVRQARGAGADFTITGQTLNVLAGMDARVGDILAIEYAYLGGVPLSPGYVVVPYSTGDWRFLQNLAGDAADYSAPSFDDSAWTVGTSQFASSGWPGSPRTEWTTTGIWIRRSIPVSPGNYRVGVRVDDTAKVYLNGAVIVTQANTTTAAGGEVFTTFAVSATGTHVLAVRGTDDAPTDRRLDIRVDRL